MDIKTCKLCGKSYERGEQNKAWFERSKYCSHKCHSLACHNTIEDVIARTVVVSITGCHLWEGATTSKGYGQVLIGGHKWLVHRFVWEQLKGKIPEGMQLDHLCRNPGCSNPEHLRVVTNKENSLAPGSMSFAARNARKLCCPRCGGEYTQDKWGSRRCIPCTRKRQCAYTLRWRKLRKLKHSKGD